MIDYIRSSSIKDYLKENEIVLTDKMAAALVTRLFDIGMEEIHKALKEIQEQTKDDVLKKQIQTYIEDDLANLDEFRQSGAEDIYELSFRDESTGRYELWEYYKEFEPADQMARTLQKECKIKKHYVIQKNDDFQLETAHGIVAQYEANGKMSFVTGSSNHCLELFDNEYYIYPHPYKRGDILKRINDQDILYIVVEDIDPDIVKEERERFQSTRDITDINIWLTGLNKLTGRIFDTDGGIHPYDFEYADVDSDTEDLAERIMLEMQKLLLGKRGSIQFIHDACLRLREEFRESQERRTLITGVKLRPYNI